jgi:hemolysin III
MQNRELISAFSHIIFCIVAIFLTVIAIKKGIMLQSTKHIISYTVYGICMILLYLTSGAYHLSQKGSSLKFKLKKLDHIMIFFMIAGTYTPFSLLILNGFWRWSILIIVWILALLGLFFKLYYIHASRSLYTTIYLLMGWIIIFAIYPLYKNLSIYGLIWLVIGGLFYTVGAMIYAIKKPDPIPNIFGFHEIWHIFVILGTTSHYIAIYFYT